MIIQSTEGSIINNLVWLNLWSVWPQTSITSSAFASALYSWESDKFIEFAWLQKSYNNGSLLPLSGISINN